MTEVVLHVYDVTNSGSDKTNNTIMQINKIFKDGIGLGGIFHSAVQVYGDEEWSFGFCEQGTGVFHCPSTQNPMELSREWPGESYDLLAKNCNHFCDEFCERLGVSKLPGWVNRFANAGDTAVEIAGNTAYRFRQAKTEIVTASKVAYRFLAGIASNNMITGPDSPGNSNGGTPRFQPTWFKNLVAPGEKPSSSSELEDEDQQHRQGTKAPL
ncbi:deSI-like protein [Salvia divinorum]|uniref:DeSI-like protein n=1 Tax=Salvia divinorum TaxID=28513 RepID=A0ABD1H9C5_SALDI